MPDRTRRNLRGLIIFASVTLGIASACGGDDTPTDDAGGADASPDAAPTDTGSNDAADGDAGIVLPPGTVRIIRDDRGIPHVLAADFSAAMYGLGWAQAEDRLFQMHFRRSRTAGRLSEHFALESPSTGAERSFNDKLMTEDRMMRTLGYARAADETIAALPAESRALLQAYAAGVNGQIADRAGALGEAFALTGITAIDAWTAADSLLVWDSISHLFGNPVGSMRAEITNLGACASGTCPAGPCFVIDEDAAVVPPPTDGMWPPSDMGGRSACLSPPSDPRPPVELKASHGFVVAGSLVAGGQPLLFGEPQLSLEAPSTWHEHHVVVPSEDIDVRGVGFAGAPGMVIFWSRHVSQTLTAGGGDLADLFELTLGRSRGTYVVDGTEEPFTTVTERIEVRGATAVDLPVQVSRYGPVVNEVLPDAPSGRLFAMRHAEMFRNDTHSIVGGIELMRADSLVTYRNALRHWVGPTVNALYAGVDAADGAGHIGFHALIGIADRAPIALGATDLTGRHPYDGSDSTQDWRGVLDLNWNAHVIDPPSGYLFSGNHLPVGTWYDAFVYAGLKGNGDTYRSLQVRVSLDALLSGGPVDPESLHALHFDAHSEAARAFLEVLREMEGRGMIPADDPDTTPGSRVAIAARVKSGLERWADEGGAMLDQRSVGAELAAAIIGRMITAARAEPYSCTWGGAEGGASHFLKAFLADPSVLGRDEASMVLTTAEAAWPTVSADLGTDVRTWAGLTDPEPFTVSYQRSFFCLVPGGGGGCSLSSMHERTPVIARNYTHTINSAHGSSYPVTVDFADVGGARALMPPGNSEEPTSPHFDDALTAIEAKGRGELDSMPLAPLDLDALTVASERELNYLP